VARVEGEKCAACLTCVRICPYEVPIINVQGEAEIELAKCHGCGCCAAECPADITGMSRSCQNARPWLRKR
jgi:heterodisulfide reductase subunit A